MGQEKADKERLKAALAQIERERTAMENIQAALGSDPWSMEFDERGEIISCIWTDVFRNCLACARFCTFYHPDYRNKKKRRQHNSAPYGKNSVLLLGYESEEDFPNRLDSWSNLLHEEDKEYVMKEYWDTVSKDSTPIFSNM